MRSSSVSSLLRAAVVSAAMIGGAVALPFMAHAQMGSARVAAFPTDAQLVVQAVEGLVEEHLLGLQHAQRVLAASSQAASGRWEEVKPLLEVLHRDVGTDAATWYMLPEGTYYTTQEGLAAQKLADRAYYPALLAGRPVMGELVVSKATGHRSIIVATPVMRDGRMVAAIGSSVRSRLLAALIEQRMAVPADLSFYAMTDQQQTVLHRNPDRIFVAPGDVGGPALAATFAEAIGRQQGTFTYTLKGQRMQASHHRSEVTGWHFFLARPLR